jgi:hypothetical protein
MQSGRRKRWATALGKTLVTPSLFYVASLFLKRCATVVQLHLHKADAGRQKQLLIFCGRQSGLELAELLEALLRFSLLSLT